MPDLTNGDALVTMRTIMARLKRWLREVLRPKRLIVLILSLVLTIFRDEIRNHLEDAVSGITVSWFKANADTAMGITNFIGHYWWAIPWCLVPLSILGVIVLAAIDSRTQTYQTDFMPRAKLDDKDLHDRAKSWLESRLSIGKLVDEAFLFGSVVHNHYSTGDVDVIVVFKPAREKQIGNAGRELHERVAPEFKQVFDRPLHFQLFCARELNRKIKFLNDTGKYEALTLKPPSLKGFARFFFRG